MSKKMDWRIAGHAGKRTLSTKDEAEYRGQDAASRWLERNDKKKGKSRPALSVPAVRGRKSDRAPASQPDRIAQA